MEEQVVKLETAKLAKEIGFDELCRLTYTQAGFVNGHPRNFGRNSETYYPSFSCMCPTQSFLQRWLREKYSIHITPKPFWDSELEQIVFDCEIIDIQDNFNEYSMETVYDTYETALEEGLIEALNKIKEMNLKEIKKEIIQDLNKELKKEIYPTKEEILKEELHGEDERIKDEYKDNE